MRVKFIEIEVFLNLQFEIIIVGQWDIICEKIS